MWRKMSKSDHPTDLVRYLVVILRLEVDIAKKHIIQCKDFVVLIT